MAVGLFTPAAVRAETILDQSNSVGSGFAWFDIDAVVQQGVRSGVTGALDRIEFLLTPDWQYPFAVSLIQDLPWTEEPAVVNVDAIRGLNDRYIADFSASGFLTTKDDSFTIEIYGDENTPGLPISFGDDHAGGTLMVNGETILFQSDLCFETYVTFVPEPPSATLSVGTILAMLAALRRFLRIRRPSAEV